MDYDNISLYVGLVYTGLGLKGEAKPISQPEKKEF